MNKIRFYIFGIPDGFDIYQEALDADIKSYYQCFYDESIKENTRLAIHRKSNGEVSYTFLKYHLFSSGNRSNAFIGLSVVFSNGYYSDVSSLYNLLEYAYNEILQKGILLQITADGNSAKFIPSKFSAEAQEVKRIESFIINTLNSKDYSIEFSAFDSSFEAGKQNAILKIPFQVYDDEIKEKGLNQLVVDRLKKYSWLSLSPDYIKKDTPTPGPITSVPTDLDEELDPITKAHYINSFEGYQGDVLAAFKQLVDKADNELIQKVNRLDKEVKGILLLLIEYSKKQNDLHDLLKKYSELAETLDTLKSQLYQKTLKQKGAEQNEVNTVDNVENVEYREQKGGKWQRYLVVAGGALVAACILIFFLSPYIFPSDDKGGNTSDDHTTTVTTTTETTGTQSSQTASTDHQIKLENLVANFNTALQSNDFEAAIGYYSEVVDRDANKMRELDNVLDKKFESLVSACDFDLANKLYLQLCVVYENAEAYETELKESFKSYIKANKTKLAEKATLIQKISYAKRDGYAYSGIDNDLRAIQALSAPSYKTTLSLTCDDGVIMQKESSEKIEIEEGKLYTIKNQKWEHNAKFQFDYRINGVELVPDGEGKTAQIKVKANKPAIGKTIKIHYKKNGNILFTVQLEVVERKQFNPNDLKVP